LNFIQLNHDVEEGSNSDHCFNEQKAVALKLCFSNAVDFKANKEVDTFSSVSVLVIELFMYQMIISLLHKVLIE
jgi:hypothetical protein